MHHFHRANWESWTRKREKRNNIDSLLLGDLCNDPLGENTRPEVHFSGSCFREEGFSLKSRIKAAPWWSTDLASLISREKSTIGDVRREGKSIRERTKNATDVSYSSLCYTRFTFLDDDEYWSFSALRSLWATMDQCPSDQYPDKTSFNKSRFDCRTRSSLTLLVIESSRRTSSAHTDRAFTASQSREACRDEIQP